MESTSIIFLRISIIFFIISFFFLWCVGACGASSFGDDVVALVVGVVGDFGHVERHRLLCILELLARCEYVAQVFEVLAYVHRPFAFLLGVGLYADA